MIISEFSEYIQWKAQFCNLKRSLDIGRILHHFPEGVVLFQNKFPCIFSTFKCHFQLKIDSQVKTMQSNVYLARLCISWALFQLNPNTRRNKNIYSDITVHVLVAAMDIVGPYHHIARCFYQPLQRNYQYF